MSAWTCYSSDGKADPKIVPPRLRIPWWKGLGADSEEKHEPAGDIDTVLVDSLKALDPNQPIREADIAPSRLPRLANTIAHILGMIATHRQPLNGRVEIFRDVSAENAQRRVSPHFGYDQAPEKPLNVGLSPASAQRLPTDGILVGDWLAAQCDANPSPPAIPC